MKIIGAYLPALLSTLFVVGCSAKVPPSETFAGQGLKIGKVEVSLDTHAIEKDRVEVFEAMGGAEVIRTKTLELLTQRNLFDPASDATLTVTVDDFRLRHGATRFFTGIWSGSDRIKGKAAVNRGTKQLLTGVLEASGGNGNPFNISRNSRGTNLFFSVGAQAVASLQRSRLGPPVTLRASAPASITPTSDISVPTAQAKTQGVVQPVKCEIDQILSMKKMGLNDVQVRAACNTSGSDSLL